MSIAKHIFSFDPDYFDFSSDEMKALGKIICQKFEQNIEKYSHVFNIANKKHWKMPFKSCYHFLPSFLLFER